MPRELLSNVLEARDCDALVRTMVLLGASRVLSAIDPSEARRTFADGVANAESLSLTGRQRMLVFDQAVRFGATADPVALAAGLLGLDEFSGVEMRSRPRRR